MVVSIILDYNELSVMVVLICFDYTEFSVMVVLIIFDYNKLSVMVVSFIIVAFLQNATIEYSSESVCVFLTDNSKRNQSR